MLWDFLKNLYVKLMHKCTYFLNEILSYLLLMYPTMFCFYLWLGLVLVRVLGVFFFLFETHSSITKMFHPCPRHPCHRDFPILTYIYNLIPTFAKCMSSTTAVMCLYVWTMLRRVLKSSRFFLNIVIKS